MVNEINENIISSYKDNKVEFMIYRGDLLTAMKDCIENGDGLFIYIGNEKMTEWVFMNVDGIEILADNPTGIEDKHLMYDAIVRGGAVILKTFVPVDLHGVLNGTVPVDGGTTREMTMHDIRSLEMKRTTIKNVLSNDTVGTLDDRVVDDINELVQTPNPELQRPQIKIGSVVKTLSGNSFPPASISPTTLNVSTENGRATIIDFIWFRLQNIALANFIQHQI